MIRKRSIIDWSIFESLMDIDALADQRTREIFGDRKSLPRDESKIAFDSGLTHEQKVGKLTALRSEKAARRAARKAARRASPFPPRSFEERITEGDVFRASGMGVTLK
jgi:hypothetical protein